MASTSSTSASGYVKRRCIKYGGSASLMASAVLLLMTTMTKTTAVVTSCSAFQQYPILYYTSSSSSARASKSSETFASSGADGKYGGDTSKVSLSLHPSRSSVRTSVSGLGMSNNDAETSGTGTGTGSSSSSSGSSKQEYSRELYLREEAESPFRKVRFFFYISLGGGALTSLLISSARIAAGLSGINEDLLEQSLVNAGVDLAGIIVLMLLYRSDLKAQESRLKRASKGAELARLGIRASKSIVAEGEAVYVNANERNEMFTTTLSALRRGRGIEKRVVIAVAGKDKMEEILRQARQYSDELSFNDLLLVPVLYPQGAAPSIAAAFDDDESKVPESVALPVGNNWKNVVEDEAQEAVSQGVDINRDGFCVVLKKNGRVGQRTKGVYLDRMVGEVVDRREAGMDVKNI